MAKKTFSKFMNREDIWDCYGPYMTEPSDFDRTGLLDRINEAQLPKMLVQKETNGESMKYENVKREDMKEVMEIEKLKRSGRDMILAALAIVAMNIGCSIYIGYDQYVFMATSLVARFFAALGTADYYAAKGRSPAWAILVFLIGFLGAIPYVFMKDLRGGKQ